VIALLVESRAALSLAAPASAARRRGERRWAIEGELAHVTVLAEARVHHQAALAAVPPHATIALPVAAAPPWTASVRAARLGGSDLVWLTAEVAWHPAGGAPFAARRGTLLVAIVAADTALVIRERPRF
jgi:hypothetical protein